MHVCVCTYVCVCVYVRMYMYMVRLTIFALQGTVAAISALPENIQDQFSDGVSVPAPA